VCRPPVGRRTPARRISANSLAACREAGSSSPTDDRQGQRRLNGQVGPDRCLCQAPAASFRRAHSRNTAKGRLIGNQCHANLQHAAGPRFQEDFESIALNARGGFASTHVGEAMLAVRPGLHDRATRPNWVQIHQLDANAGRSNGVITGGHLLRQAGPRPSGVVVEQSGVQDIACPSWRVSTQGEFHERIGDGRIESLRIA